MRGPALRRCLAKTETILFLLGLLCVGFCIFVSITSRVADAASERLTPASATPRAPGQVLSASALSAQHPTAAVPMARLEIPDLHLSVPILSDYDTNSLLKGIGYIPGTARPGGLGTLGLAGHRDTYFRPLRNIRKKMEILVSDGSGTYHYLVDSTEIVKPEDVSVLDIGDRPGLALITCYPFYYVGAAPLRFIVHAHLVSALADPA